MLYCLVWIESSQQPVCCLFLINELHLIKGTNLITVTITLCNDAEYYECWFKFIVMQEEGTVVFPRSKRPIIRHLLKFK